MNGLSGEIIGNINVTVVKSSEGSNFFYLEADNKKVLHVLDYIENSLNNY